MNKTVTSKESILAACKDIVAESGMAALNMRNVAKKCGVAVGSVYNYFPSKDDLTIAAVESIWSEIISYDEDEPYNLSFEDAVTRLFENVQKGSKKYPIFLIIHSMRMLDVDKEKGRAVMISFFIEIEHHLLKSLNDDPNVDQSVFDATFTKEEFIHFVFSNILSLNVSREPDSKFLISVIRRTIY